MQRFFTTREVGDLCRQDEWRIRRLFEDGDLPEPPKFGGKRLISAERLPEIMAALHERGWLAAPQTTGAAT